MQTPIMKQLGDRMRKKIPVSNDLPPRILMALQRLAASEKDAVAGHESERREPTPPQSADAPTPP
jgi:hypothetical protein